ncbi:futalosine hydrolase [Streptomyces sp. NRRL B-1677]|uniref:Futalosine hydrolase n=1 Tax=Streptomyces klenkii TaxID=1420899 RepID=A0A3B0BC35_9ACTN|nr:MULTISPECIES: futalosine hydrolase [Streptomyces]MBF6044229.1 futalosine hydrolase [Streptomyces sp. NRRL B-1677]RKN70340.1 futalosine hydrolase [Streptomyces klenkii]
MRVLVVTAVAAERDAVVRGAAAAGTGPAEEAPGRVAELALPGYVLHRPAPAGPQPLVIDVLAAGVGPAAAAAGTATALAAAALSGSPYDLAVSAGIGGGFTATATATAAAPGRTAPVGSVVVSDAIVAADLGAETPTGFVPVTELGFGTVEHRPPAALVRAVAEAAGAQRGDVLTVSTVTGSAERAAALVAARPGALAEAMEGFGVAEAAAAHGVPVLEIRAVSNPVGPRDRAAWRIGDALEALAGASAALREALRAAPAETWSSS